MQVPSSPPDTHLWLGTTGAIQEPATPAARSGGEGPGSAHTEGALCRPTKPSLCSAAPTAPLQTNADIPYCFPRKLHPGCGGVENEGEEEEEDEEEAALAGQPPPAQPLTRGSAAPALRGSARSLRGGWGGRCSPRASCHQTGPGRAEPSRAKPGQAAPALLRWLRVEKVTAGAARGLRGCCAARSRAQQQPRSASLKLCP